MIGRVIHAVIGAVTRAAGGRVVWPAVIAAGVAAGWAGVLAMGGADFGRVRFEVAGAAAAVAVAAVLTARVTSVPTELLTPYAVAVLAGSAVVALAGSAGASVLDDAASPPWLVFVAAAAGTVAAGRRQWPLALGILALASALSGLVGGFWLLGASTAVVAAVGHRAALVTALPAAALAVDAALASGGAAATAVATAVVASAAWGLAGVRQPPRTGARHVPALVIGSMVLFVPHTWTWAGVDRFDAELLARTARGVTVTLAVGALAVVLGWLTGQVAPPRPEAARGELPIS